MKSPYNIFLRQPELLILGYGELNRQEGTGVFAISSLFARFVEFRQHDNTNPDRSTFYKSGARLVSVGYITPELKPTDIDNPFGHPPNYYEETDKGMRVLRAHVWVLPEMDIELEHVFVFPDIIEAVEKLAAGS